MFKSQQMLYVYSVNVTLKLPVFILKLSQTQYSTNIFISAAVMLLPYSSLPIHCLAVVHLNAGVPLYPTV